jgi:hypothetical protein
VPEGRVTTKGFSLPGTIGMISGTQITPLRRADIPELSRFLGSDPAAAYLFSHDVLLWKYFDGPGSPSDDSVSSLIARSAGRIIGRIGMCPRQFIVTGAGKAPVSTMHAIDWRGSDEHPGLGALLMLRAIATSRTQYAIGGTVEAQAVFPRLGFEQNPKLAIFRKVLAPLHRLRTTGQGLLRKWGGNSQGCGVRLASAQTALFADRRTAPGTCVHPRNRSLATKVFPAHRDVPA